MADDRVQRLSDVCVNPYHFVSGKFNGGIESETACLFARMPWGEDWRDVPTPRHPDASYLPGRYLYAGPLWNHFGHVMVDSIHRLWAYRGHDAIVFNGVVGLRGVRSPADLAAWAYPPLIDYVLSVVGIDAEVRIVREPTIFQELDVPEPGAVWRGRIKPFYRNFLKKYQSALVERTKSLDAPRRIYYSRNHLLNRGGILGSSYLEEILKNNDFEVVRPEKLTWDQQFANLLKADQVIFDEGSSIHLSEMFDYLPPRVYMLPRRTLSGVFERALTPRGGLTTLASGENVALLPDGNGLLPSPAALSCYKNPQPVVERMFELGLSRLHYNQAKFYEAELKDLLSAKARDDAVMQQRLDRLTSLRNTP